MPDHVLGSAPGPRRATHRSGRHSFVSFVVGFSFTSVGGGGNSRLKRGAPPAPATALDPDPARCLVNSLSRSASCWGTA